jgi:hypothetical protein
MWNVHIRWHDGLEVDLNADRLSSERVQWKLHHENGGVTLIPRQGVRYLRQTKKAPEADA